MQKLQLVKNNKIYKIEIKKVGESYVDGIFKGDKYAAYVDGKKVGECVPFATPEPGSVTMETLRFFLQRFVPDYKKYDWQRKNGSIDPLCIDIETFCREVGIIITKTWKTNLVTVEEVAFDHDLHAFEVYAGDKLLGTINPDSIADMMQIKADLDTGGCPVAEGWEDGKGNTCTLDGWENE